MVLNQWIIKGGTLDPNPTCEYKSAGGKVLYECTIEVYTANTNNQRYSHNGKSVNNNNTIDDIVFSVMY